MVSIDVVSGSRGTCALAGQATHATASGPQSFSTTQGDSQRQVISIIAAIP
jgi:hypothetical protein